jgi:hypothetical protein
MTIPEVKSYLNVLSYRVITYHGAREFVDSCQSGLAVYCGVVHVRFRAEFMENRVFWCLFTPWWISSSSIRTISSESTSSDSRVMAQRSLIVSIHGSITSPAGLGSPYSKKGDIDTGSPSMLHQ